MHGEDFDGRADRRGVRGRVSPDERVWRCKPRAQRPDAVSLRGRQDVAGEDGEAPAAVGFEEFLEVPGAGVRLVEDF